TGRRRGEKQERVGPPSPLARPGGSAGTWLAAAGRMVLIPGALRVRRPHRSAVATFCLAVALVLSLGGRAEAQRGRSTRPAAADRTAGPRPGRLAPVRARVKRVLRRPGERPALRGGPDQVRHIATEQGPLPILDLTNPAFGRPSDRPNRM